MTGTMIAAWLDVRTKPFRTFAAIAGMVAAVVAVVLVDAAAVLSHEANNTYLARQYGLPMTVNISDQTGSVTPEQADQLQATLLANGITALSRDVSVPAAVTYQGQDVRDGMRWLSSAYNRIRIVDMVAGTWPTDTGDSDVLHIVLHEGWAETNLGLSDQQVVGQVLGYVTVNERTDFRQTNAEHPMVVDGVVAIDTNAFTTGTSEVIIVSDRPNDGLIPAITSATWVARVNPTDFNLLRELVTSVANGSGQPIYRLERADATDTLAPVLDQQSVTARIVTIVALTIGGLGILGVGIAGVRERAKDFGLRRALGASRMRIFSGVIVQTLIEVLLAAVIAIPLAAILLGLFARDLVLETLPLPPSTSLPLSSAVLGLAGALLVGLVAGLIPAVNAARASVVQALRG